MKIFPNIKFAHAKEERRQGELGFTMIEIAIAIGVIGFALVAIIGILPAGMTVQKDDREDNVISQDASYFMDAIRNGVLLTNGTANVGHGLDFLTNYVISIQRFQYSNESTSFGNSLSINPTICGAQIIGLLSAPEPTSAGTNFYTYTRAIVRALSGPATDQGASSTATAFMYQMDVEVTPFDNIAYNSIDYLDYPVGSADYITRYNRWLETAAPVQGQNGLSALTYNLFDLKLHFSWPVIYNGTAYVVVGQGRQTYRTVIGSQLIPQISVNSSATSTASTVLPGALYWFFQPQTYTNSTPAGL